MVGAVRPVRATNLLEVANGFLLQEIVYSQDRSRSVALSGDTLTVALEQIHDAGCRIESLIGGFSHTIKEKFKPSFPCALLADFLQKAVIVGTMRLEIEAEIEERLMQDILNAEIERHQQTANAAIAVQEGMDGLELHVEEASLDQRQAGATLLRA